MAEFLYMLLLFKNLKMILVIAVTCGLFNLHKIGECGICGFKSSMISRGITRWGKSRSREYRLHYSLRPSCICCCDPVYILGTRVWPQGHYLATKEAGKYSRCICLYLRYACQRMNIWKRALSLPHNVTPSVYSQHHLNFVRCFRELHFCEKPNKKILLNVSFVLCTQHCMQAKLIWKVRGVYNVLLCCLVCVLISFSVKGMFWVCICFSWPLVIESVWHLDKSYMR